MNIQAKLLKAVIEQMRFNPCRLDLGLFETQPAKPTLAALIVETAAKSGLSDLTISPNGNNIARAAQLLNLTNEDAVRLLRVTYWSEPFASACICSAFEYLDELAEFKFRFEMTESQQENSRKVLKLFAYQAIVEICVLRILFFFATDKTDEAENFDLKKISFASDSVNREQFLMKVDFWRRFPAEKINSILRFKHERRLL